MLFICSQWSTNEGVLDNKPTWYGQHVRWNYGVAVFGDLFASWFQNSFCFLVWTARSWHSFFLDYLLICKKQTKKIVNNINFFLAAIRLNEKLSLSTGSSDFCADWVIIWGGVMEGNLNMIPEGSFLPLWLSKAGSRRRGSLQTSWPRHLRDP